MAGMLQRLLTLGVLLLLTGFTSALKGPPELSAVLGWPLSLGCQYEEGFQTHKKYWCKGPIWNSCIYVVQTDGTEAEIKAGRTSIQDNHTRLEFTVRLENVSQEDAGIYWCGITQSGPDPVFQIKITALPVSFPGFTSAVKGPPELSAVPGWPLSLGCQYEEGYRTHKKYWCEGSSWSYCTIIVLTDGTEAEAKADRTSIQDNHTRLEFTVRLENISQEDAGIYWCAIEKVGSDPGVQIQITALPVPTPMMTTAIITTNVPTVTDFPTTATPSHDFLYMILLPIVFLVLVVILIGAILLMCRLKKQKAAKACKDVPWSLAPSASVQPTDGPRREAAPLPLNPSPGNTIETEYASVRMAPTSADSLPQVFTNTENVSYATLKFSTLEEEPTYANVE